MNKALKKVLEWLYERMPRGNTQDSMRVVIAYGVLIAAISAAFFGAWTYNGFAGERFETDEMLRFFSAATSAGPVAAVTFLSVFLVDKNRDGRPDAAEERVDRK